MAFHCLDLRILVCQAQDVTFVNDRNSFTVSSSHSTLPEANFPIRPTGRGFVFLFLEPKEVVPTHHSRRIVNEREREREIQIFLTSYDLSTETIVERL